MGRCDELVAALTQDCEAAAGRPPASVLLVRHSEDLDDENNRMPNEDIVREMKAFVNELMPAPILDQQVATLQVDALAAQRKTMEELQAKMKADFEADRAEYEKKFASLSAELQDARAKERAAACQRSAASFPIMMMGPGDYDGPAPRSYGGTNSGRTIFTGPRGGRYYINNNGNKSYLKK